MPQWTRTAWRRRRGGRGDSDDALLRTDPGHLLSTRGAHIEVFTARLFGQPTRCLATPGATREFFRVERASFVIRDKCPAQHHELFGDSVFGLVGAAHRTARRSLAPAMLPTTPLTGYAEKLAPLCADTVDSWARAGVADLHAACRTFTIAACTQVVLGLADPTAAARFAAAFEAFSAGTGVAPRLRRLRPAYRRALHGRAELRAMVREALAADTPRSGSMLHWLVQDGDDGTRAALSDHVLAILVAARETSASLLLWSLVELSRPAAATDTALREEALQARSTPALVVSRSRLTRLRAFLWEVERVHPPNTLALRQATRRCSIAGTIVEAGDVVAYFPAVHNLDPVHFPRPERFDPARFAGATSAHLLTFGAGPRACIGKQFAETMVLSMMAAMFGRYHPVLIPDAERIAARHVPVKVPDTPVALTLRKWSDDA